MTTSEIPSPGKLHIPSAHGNHIIVEGTPKALCDWLHPKGKIWVGRGHPMMQEFSYIQVNNEPFQS